MKLIKKINNNNNIYMTLQEKWFDGDAIVFRGNDGQVPVTVDSILNAISDMSSNKSNPWEDFMNNAAPAFSGTILANNLYPILWYVPKYVDPFYTKGDTDPPIGERNQGGFILKYFGFQGASLWDGNSNKDIAGSISIPPTTNSLGNRGTDTLSYANNLPYTIGFNTPKIGNASYSPPDTNNTNKLFNPTFNAQKDGSIGTDSSENNEIMKKFTRLKDKLWEKIFDPVSPLSAINGDPSSYPKVNQIAKNLEANWGSGFEIEGYFYPKKYIDDETYNIWTAYDASNSYFNVDDLECISISTDAFDKTSWVQTGVAQGIKLENAIKNIWQTAVSGASMWIDPISKDLTKTSITLDVILVTNVFLPVVAQQSVSTSKASALELIDYIRNYEFKYTTLALPGEKVAFVPIGKIEYDLSTPNSYLNPDFIPN